MSKQVGPAAAGRGELLRWLGGIGAATAEALARREEVSVASARATLTRATRDGLLARTRPLADQPSLYTLTRAGLGAARVRGLEPCRVSATNALHLIVCASVAVALERCYPEHRVVGERELRREERLGGAPLASARLGADASAVTALHRPDMVMWPDAPADGLPVAVEVELAVKAPRRLAAICRAWARCREVAGVLYLASAEAERALARAVVDANASPRVLVLPLDALAGVDAPAQGRGTTRAG
jgi:hypothetical protein